MPQLLGMPGLQVGSVSPTLAPAAAPAMAAAPGLTVQRTPAQAPGALQPQASAAFPWAVSAQGPAQPTRLVPSWTPAAIQLPAGPAQVCCSEQPCRGKLLHVVYQDTDPGVLQSH